MTGKTSRVAKFLGDVDLRLTSEQLETIRRIYKSEKGSLTSQTPVYDPKR